MDKRKRNKQYRARRKVYQVHQYWNINYTEKYSDGSEKDFKTFIKAKSYAFAKEILLKRLREDDPSIKIKAVHGFLLHKNYKSQGRNRLGVTQWDLIRKASFPNGNNTLFKHHVSRDPNKSNRFNETDHEHLKTIGFQSGEKNWSTINRKGKILPINKRSHMVFKGKWIPWDKVCRDNTRKEIINALIRAKNVRQNAAKILNISRNKLYKLMSRFPEVNWDEEYPKPNPFENARKPDPKVMSEAQKKAMKKRMDNGEIPFNLTPEQAKKRDIGIAKARERQKKSREERLNKQIPLIKEALEACNNKRNKAAEYLGWKVSYLAKTMYHTKHIVDWANEYPNSSICKKYL